MSKQEGRVGKKIKINKYSFFLITILVVATLLRFIGTKPGYHPTHSDETTIRSTVVGFIKNNNLEPYRYEYPALTNLANYFFYKFFFIPLGWLKFFISNFNQILSGLIKFPLGPDVYNKTFQLEILGSQNYNTLFWSRWITALFGVGVVWATYLVGKKLFNEWVALISAFLVCINYRQVLNSHFGLPDIYNAFFFLLSFWAILYLREKINLWRSVLCGIVLGLHLSIKYQIFPFVALFLVYLEKTWERHSFKEKIVFLFNRKFILIPIISLSVFLFLNPYLIINLETALSQLSYASLKYGKGSMKLLIYPYSYLFKIGIGKITSLIVIFGILLSLVKERWKSILLLSVIVSYFYFFTFYTSGGFYTRNFVSVIPLLLIFAAYAIYQLIRVRPRIVFTAFTLLVFSLAAFENLKNSLVMVSAYTQTWNRSILEGWIKNNIPEGKKIAGHSSVPIPSKYQRLPYDKYPSFTLNEFSEMDADYAITSFDWATRDFYGWMRQTMNNEIRYWDKPTAILKQTFSAMAIEEMSLYTVYSIINPWQAPDLDFMVVKLPSYSVLSRQLKTVYRFTNDSEGWTAEGLLEYGNANLYWSDGKLEIGTGASASQILHWESEPISADGWQGFEIDYRIKTELASTRREGFLFISFYKNIEDAREHKNRISVRLGERNDIFNKWVARELIGLIPEGTKLIRIGFQSYNSADAAVFLDDVVVYQAEVQVDNIDGTKPLKLDENILFPVSHGNL